MRLNWVATHSPNCLRSALCDASPAVCKDGLDRHAQNRSTHLWSEGSTHLRLNMMKDLDISRFLDLHKYGKKKLFQEGS